MADPVMTPEDQNAIDALIDLGTRCGATGFQIGYLHDGVPVEQMGWYAHLQFKGARLTAENHTHPAAAAKALAERVLSGGRCRCGKLVALSDGGAVAFNGTLVVDGTRWTRAQAAAAGQCRWRLVGARWEPSCPPPKERE